MATTMAASTRIRTSTSPFFAGLVSVVEDQLRLAGRVDARVLISAENPDLREMCARFIHCASLRRARPLIVLRTRIADPAPKSISRRFFERARGGTLFIDGIEELSGGVQAELSSWLEKGVSSVPPVDKTQSPVRIIAGASGLLESRRSSGTFSETLFYRLNVIHIDLSRYRVPNDIGSNARLD